MRKINLLLVGAAVVALTTLTTGCKKDKDKTPDNSSKTAKPNDQQGSSEADEAISDVNDFINNKVGGGANQKVSAYNLPCGVVQIDSTDSGGNRTYKFTYGNQTPCGYKKKSGEVSFARSIAVPFNQAGGSHTITFTNYVVEVVATGAVVTLNGTITVTNQTGGYIWEPILNSSTTVTHKLRGTFTVTYSDNTQRAKSYYQLRTWASTGGWAGLSLTIAGDTTIGASTIYEIGKTYEGNYDYQTEMITNYVWSNCGTTYAGPYKLKIGHARLNVTVPFLSPTYIDVEGGYYWDYSNATATPTLVNDCSTNAYKINTVLGSSNTTQYQLY